MAQPVATALYAALRKGELFALPKTDVNLSAAIIDVAASHDSDTTKGDHVDSVPIAAPLLPYLRAAIDSSSSRYVFPNGAGRRHPPKTNLTKVLRSALARAGVVDGYEHVCRRCKARGTPHAELHEDAGLRLCPTCGMKLWPRALPRMMRFHDLRHSTATLLLRASVDLHHVQRILRHQDVKLTVDTYGHLQVEDLRDAINKLPGAQPATEVTKPRPAEPARQAVAAASFLTHLLPDHGTVQNGAAGLDVSLVAMKGNLVEQKGIEPSASALRTRRSPS